MMTDHKKEENQCQAKRGRKAKMAAESKISMYNQQKNKDLRARRKKKLVVYIPLYIHDERLLASNEEESVQKVNDEYKEGEKRSTVSDAEEEEEATEHAASLRMLDDPRIVSESDTSFYEASDTDGDDDPEEFIQNKKLKRDKAIKKKEAECIFQCMDCALSFASKGSYFFHLRHTHNQHKIPFRSRGLDTKNKDFIPDFEQDTIEDITIHHVETQVQDQPKITAATTQKKVLVDSHVNAPSSEESLDEEDVSIKEPMIPITLPATRLPFYCQLCNRLELNEIRYQLHMQLYHAKSTTSIRSDKKENAGEAYQCPICDIVKPNRRSYLKHLSIIHKQVPSPK